MVPGLSLASFRARQLHVQVGGGAVVGGHDVDECADLVNNTLVVGFFVPVERVHGVLVCAVVDEETVGGGEAQFYRTVKVTEGGKMKSRRVWNEFGTAGGRNDGVQYVAYDLSESFTMDALRELLTKFVDGLNKAAGFEAYDLVLPDDETECAQIVYA